MGLNFLWVTLMRGLLTFLPDCDDKKQFSLVYFLYMLHRK
jgi:hypothetical protein